MPKFLIRLDDACPTMNHSAWREMLELLDEHRVSPLIGVVPCNSDPALCIDDPSKEFWHEIRGLAKSGAEICMHGYDHVYLTSQGGLNPVNAQSEFAGLPLVQQREKIRLAWAEFQRNNITPRVFFAPSHTFDLATLQALKMETPIRVISDTVALRPYHDGDFVFLPQQMGRCRYVPVGIITFCYHPNSMTNEDFSHLRQFLAMHSQKFVRCSQVLEGDIDTGEQAKALLQPIYFTYRKIRAVLKG